MSAAATSSCGRGNSPAATAAAGAAAGGDAGAGEDVGAAAAVAGAAAAAISRHRVKKVRNERGDGVSPDGSGMYNTNLFPGQALGPDLDRLRLIGAPAAVVYSVIISAPTLKFFIIEAALPLGRRKLFDTLQDPHRFSVVPIATRYSDPNHSSIAPITSRNS